MIQDEYIKFETAKLLKEKGFDEKCGYCYAFFDEDDIRVLELKHHISGLSLAEERYPYVTQSVAMKWLREAHNKFCDVSFDYELGWYYQIVDLKEIVEYDYPEMRIYHHNDEYSFSTYEQACEAAIKYCLENLI